MRKQTKQIQIRRNSQSGFVIELGIFIILYSAISYTQIFAADAPPGQDPGAQAERYKYDVDKEKQRLEHKIPKAADIKIEREKAVPTEGGVSFELKEIKVTGSTIFKQQDFRQIYEPYLSKKVTFSDLNVISKKIESKYKEKGYFTTSVYIPEQDIKDGVIEIRVAEGRMGKIALSANAPCPISLRLGDLKGETSPVQKGGKL